MKEITIINILLWVLIWNLVDFLITYFNIKPRNGILIGVVLILILLKI
jgi:hypothetical protein